MHLSFIQGMTLGYPRNDMVSGFQGHRLGLELRQHTAWVRTSLNCKYFSLNVCAHI